MDENNEPQVPPDNDRTPTQQDETAGQKRNGGWIMPEPVFRSSSGYLPKGFEQRAREAQGQAAAPAMEISSEPPVNEDPVRNEAPAEAGIAAQPDVDALEEEPITPALDASVPRKKRSVLGVILMVIGLIIAFGAIAAIVAAVIFWYFLPTGESQSLN